MLMPYWTVLIGLVCFAFALPVGLLFVASGKSYPPIVGKAMQVSIGYLLAFYIILFANKLLL